MTTIKLFSNASLIEEIKRVWIETEELNDYEFRLKIEISDRMRVGHLEEESE